MMLIGLTAALDDNVQRSLLNLDYTQSVLRGGALPLVLPICTDEKALDAMFDAVDALVFTGGADVAPSLYGEEKLPFCGELCPDRDQMEIHLLRRALNEGKPFLAICRGFELFNIILGGTLYQDIAQQMSDEIYHPRYETPRTKVHGMNVVKGSLLHTVTGLDTFEVNSRHHQGVKTVGKGLVVSATAPDGLVEGLELPDHPLAFGIQWHPEALSDRYPEALAIFKLLTARAEEYHRRKKN